MLCGYDEKWIRFRRGEVEGEGEVVLIIVIAGSERMS